MDYKVISADTHLDTAWLPGDLFTDNAPAHLKDRMPYVTEGKHGGKVWEIGGEYMCGAGVGGNLTQDFAAYVPGQSHHLDRMAEVGFFEGQEDGIYHPSDPELRIKDQDIDGVDAEVVYGILGIGGGGFSGPGFRNFEVTTAIYDVYNEWVSDLFRPYSNRIAGLGCLSSHDPEVAARQLRDCADLGLRGAEINAGKMPDPAYHKAWEPLWQAASETQMPISFHTLGYPHRTPSPEDQEEYGRLDMGLRFIMFQLSGIEFLVSMVLSGACIRNPDFQFVLGECGIGWIPYVIERTDIKYDDRLFHLGFEMKPSDYWRRQGYSTFQQEYVSTDEIERIGVDNIMWGSDYPHPDGVFPDSAKAIEEGLGHLDAAVRQKLTCDNAARVYKFN